MSQGEASNPLAPVLEISSIRQGGNVHPLREWRESCRECWKSVSTGRDSTRVWLCPRALPGCVGWAHREAKSEQGFQQQPENLCKDVGSGPALDPTGLAAPLCICCTLAGLWTGVLCWERGLELQQGHQDKGAKGRACPSLQSSVHAGQIVLLKPQIRAQIVPPSVQATPPLYLQLPGDAGLLTGQQPSPRAALPTEQVWVPGSCFPLPCSGME